MSSFWLVTCSLCFTISSVGCRSVFVRVETSSSTEGPRDNTTVYNCGNTCLEKTTGNDFCFGFTIAADGGCLPSMVPGIPNSGDYYMLRDYRGVAQTPQCGDDENAIRLINATYVSTDVLRIFNGKLLVLDGLKKNGDECKRKCKSLQMDRISIHSAAENEYIKNTVCDLFYPSPCGRNADLYGHICHLGIDINKETWRFSDGTPKDYDRSKFPRETLMECAQMRNLGDWNVADCTRANVVSHCVCSAVL